MNGGKDLFRRGLAGVAFDPYAVFLSQRDAGDGRRISFFGFYAGHVVYVAPGGFIAVDAHPYSMSSSAVRPVFHGIIREDAYTGLDRGFLPNLYVVAERAPLQNTGARPDLARTPDEGAVKLRAFSDRSIFGNRAPHDRGAGRDRDPRRNHGMGTDAGPGGNPDVIPENDRSFELVLIGLHTFSEIHAFAHLLARRPDTAHVAVQHGLLRVHVLADVTDILPVRLLGYVTVDWPAGVEEFREQIV